MDSITIKLNTPALLNGVRTDQITLRAPLVRDMRLASRQAPSDEEERELALFASLAGVSTSDLEGLRFADYTRVQDAYFRLLSAGKAPAGNTGDADAPAGA